MFSILKTLKSVFNIKKNSIVIDNVETYKNTDIQLFNEYLKETKIPILFICNNRYDIKLKQISNQCLDVKLLPPTNNEIFIFLNKIIQKEKIIIKNEDIYMLINYSKNDIRNILINLEIMVLLLKE
jgi:replication factor C subunit 1